MKLCPACGEPLDDFSPCACAFGHTRTMGTPASLGGRTPSKAIPGGMRGMVERKLRHRALAAQNVTITPKR